MKIFKRVLSFGLAVAVCGGVAAFYGAAQYSVAEAATASTYYNGITATGGTELLGQLHDLITTTHTQYSTYGDIRKEEIVSKTDSGSSNGYIMDFYTQEDISVVWDSNSPAGAWNREHLWCQSLSNGLWTSVNNQSKGGGADLHHLRPSEVKLNATRGNLKYGEVVGGASSYGTAYYIGTNGANKYVGGYYRGNTFEPLDKVKGDVARIVLYVYAHYNTFANVHGSTNGRGEEYYFGTLNFTDIMSASTETAAIKLLLEWNKSDPVDEIETKRNEEVYKLQGNRNPFIDNESYADAIWGEGTVTPPVTPPDTPTDGKVKAFHDAVAAIDDDKALAARLAQINAAVTAYGKLSDAERATCSADITALRAKIGSYNEAVKAYNGAAEVADEEALKGAGRFH